MRRVCRLSLSVFLAAVAVAGACGPAAFAAHDTPKIISITYVKFPLNAPLILAKVLGLYEKEFAKDGSTVEWPALETGPGQADALAAGAVQFASALSADSVLGARSRGEPVRAFAVFARAPRAFCLMTKNPALKSMAGLKGRTVAGPKGTQLHLMLMAGLEKAGLSDKDITFVNMSVPQSMSALLSGGVDAALAAGPGRIKAEADGASVVVCGEGLTKGLILTAVNEDFAREHPDMVDRYRKVQAEALEFLTSHPAEARAMIAQETGISQNDVERLLPEYDFSPNPTESDLAALADIQTFLLRTGMMAKPAGLAGFFLPEAPGQ